MCLAELRDHVREGQRFALRAVIARVADEITGGSRRRIRRQGIAVARIAGEAEAAREGLHVDAALKAAVCQLHQQHAQALDAGPAERRLAIGNEEHAGRGRRCAPARVSRARSSGRR